MSHKTQIFLSSILFIDPIKAEKLETNMHAMLIFIILYLFSEEVCGLDKLLQQWLSLTQC